MNVLRITGFLRIALSQVFLRARSDISEHLYGDVLQCLEWLQSIGVAVGVMTNGNANLADCSLAPYLSLVLTAGWVGGFLYY